MKIFLFGGAEVGETKHELKMIEKVIKQTKTKQVLHIPFARTTIDEEEWMPGWFKREINLEEGVEYLNAENKEDIAKANIPLIFISGGNQILNLKKELNENAILLSLVMNSPYVIGESAGAKILAKYFRKKTNENDYEMHKGLGIIENTVIEGHYTQRKRNDILKKFMELTNVKYGIGIDSITALEFDLEQFPATVKKIGDGLAEIKGL